MITEITESYNVYINQSDTNILKRFYSNYKSIPLIPFFTLFKTIKFLSFENFLLTVDNSNKSFDIKLNLKALLKTLFLAKN